MTRKVRFGLSLPTTADFTWLRPAGRIELSVSGGKGEMYKVDVCDRNGEFVKPHHK